jgi:thiamine biosynthesis protein ThiS
MILVNNRDSIKWKEGMTVRDVLDTMGYRYSLITVLVNGNLVPAEEYDAFPVPDNAEVVVFHLAHGG